MTETGKNFAAVHVDDALEVVAPDGSAVRVLVRTANGSMVRFSLRHSASRAQWGIAR